MACDIRLDEPDAVLLPPFHSHGMVPDRGLSWLLPRLLGEGRALEILLSGLPVDACRCEQLGLFPQVCAHPLSAAKPTRPQFLART
ncbi:MAG TPA: enoyl-CoA hydratase-related protein [Pseudonocardiaceae bacterium]